VKFCGIEGRIAPDRLDNIQASRAMSRTQIERCEIIVVAT
jgi:hypothetical protein